MTDFRRLHVPGDPLIMPNPWDVGSAVMLQSLGAKALATTSAGAAYAMGKCDGTLNLTQMLDNARAINAATDVPVSADLENGGGDTPDAAGDAIRAAAHAGLAGASIEDLSAGPEPAIYPRDLAVARVTAAVQAAQQTGIVLTARCEGLLTGTLTRAQVADRISAYAKAGADVVFAPGLKTSDDVAAIMKAAGNAPVSVLIGANHPDLSIRNLAGLGVARISVGSALARAAYGNMISVMQTALSGGDTLSYPETTVSFDDIEKLLRR